MVFNYDVKIGNFEGKHPYLPSFALITRWWIPDPAVANRACDDKGCNFEAIGHGFLAR
jgi:hypothetical protein